MLRRLDGAALCAALALVPFVAVRPAAACSVCLAGDPLFSTQGTTAQQQGDFSAYFQVQGWRKSSGALPHGHEHEHEHEHGEEEPGGGVEPEQHEEEEAGDEESRSERLDLFLSWTPLDRTTLTLGLPFAFNRIVETEGDERTRSTLAGFGDASLTGSFVLWRDRAVLPGTWVELRAMLKAPTGRDDEEVDGRPDIHLQPGTGSWDFGGGLAATHRRAWGSLYASAFYRENTEGALDYEYGDALLVNAAVEVPLGHGLGGARLARLTPGFELNFRYAGHDLADGERFDDSGGAILYATPSLRVRLPELRAEAPPSLRFAVQLPLTQSWLHDEQHEEEVWSAGLFVPF
jgi:hypothetical protein